MDCGQCSRWQVQAGCTWGRLALLSKPALPSVLIGNNGYSIPPAFTDRGHLIVPVYIEARYVKAFKKPLICENKTFGLQNNVISCGFPENRCD